MGGLGHAASRGQSARRSRVAIGLGTVAIVASALIGEAPAGAAFPGINGKVTCQANRTGSTEVWSFNPNGTELETTDLTRNPNGLDGRGRYSPDGRLIAFESARTGRLEIFIMNADGTDVRQLTFTGDNSGANWHPDGSQIVFQSNRGGGPTNIFKINIDGTGETQITNLPVDSIQPAWSPDGTKIAFGSVRQDPAGEVYIMDPDGSNVERLTNSPGVDGWPTWSPDGTQIAFNSALGDPSQEIYRMNVDGTGRTRLTFSTTPRLANDREPAWSPDGTRILWSSNRTANPNGSGNTDAWHMNAVDGSDPRRITSHTAAETRCDWQPLCTIYGAGDIMGTDGDDIICGSDGADRIFGGGGNDRILGLGGDDQISGGEGDDTLFGGMGNDSISGGNGSDFPSGGPGDDRIIADPGERIDVGAGTDQCSVSRVSGCPPRIS